MIVLENLNCPVCAAKIEKAAQNLPGMKEAKVSFGTGSLTVTYDKYAPAGTGDPGHRPEARRRCGHGDRIADPAPPSAKRRAAPSLSGDGAARPHHVPQTG